MRSSIAAACGAFGLSLLACLAACSNMSPEQQAKLQQALTVACNVDGSVVPVAQPVVAGLGSTGSAFVTVDALLVHPAVVAACQQLGGAPASVAPASAPVGATRPAG